MWIGVEGGGLIVVTCRVGGGGGVSAVNMRTKRRRISRANSHMAPVCRAASCMFSSPRRTTGEFTLGRKKGVCAELAGPAARTFRGEVTTVRKKATTCTATDKVSTVFCAVVGLASINSGVMSTSGLCNKACRLFRGALRRLNHAIAFMSSRSPRLFRRTVSRGAGTVCMRSVKGPGLSVPSFSELTRVTRSRKVPLVTSGAINVKSMEPFSRNISVVSSSTAGCVNKRKAALNKVVVRGNSFS